MISEHAYINKLEAENKKLRELHDLLSWARKKELYVSIWTDGRCDIDDINGRIDLSRRSLLLALRAAKKEMGK